jgi:hypothetical protein
MDLFGFQKGERVEGVVELGAQIQKGKFQHVFFGSFERERLVLDDDAVNYHKALI